jgi:DNA ligase (NAD+)
MDALDKIGDPTIDALATWWGEEHNRAVVERWVAELQIARPNAPAPTPPSPARRWSSPAASSA